MPKTNKASALTLLLIVAFLAAAAAATIFFLDRNKEQARRIWAEDQLEKIKTAKENLEKERDELIKAKQALEGQVSDVSTQAKKLADDLAAEKRAREAVSAELVKTRGEADDLTGQLRTQEDEKKAITEELAKAKQSYQALSNELTTLRQAKEALERRVKEMLTSQASEAEKIVVKPAQSAAPGEPAPAAAAAPAVVAPAAAAPSPAVSAAPPALKTTSGKVLVVNREFNFVVVNLGTKDGMQIGTKVNIFRSDKKIGSAQVERVYENMSAATLLAEEQKGQIKEGDQIRVVS